MMTGKPQAADIRTMEDFAAYVGLSRPTVSKFFNDPASVRSNTRKRIEQAIGASGFRPNLFAVNLKRRRTRILGVIIPNAADPFYMELTRRIEEIADAAGYFAVVLSSAGRPDLEVEAIERFQSMNIAGAIVAPLGADFPEAAIKVERLWDYPGLGTASDAGVVNFVKSLTGANGTFKVAFGTEGGLFDARLGIPTVICGPGSMAQGHKPDEFVAVEQMQRCQEMMATLIDRLEAGF